MSEKNLPKMLWIALAEIVYIAQHNFSRMTGNFFRDENDQKNLITKLFTGWDDTLGHLKVRELTKEEVEIAILLRESEWEVLKKETQDFSITFFGDEAKTTVTPSEKLRIFEQMYTKNGKVIKPKYEGIYGFRRNSVITLVNTFRFKKALPLIENVPCSVVSYDNPKGLDRIADCIRENEGKLEGAKVIDDKDYARAGYEMFNLGANESKFRQVFKAGSGQKFYKICQLNKKYPDLKIIENIEKGELIAKSWDKELMREIVNDSWVPEKVLEYLKNPNGGENPAQMANKTTIKNLQQNDIDVVGFLMKAVLENDLVAALKTLAPYRDELNKVTAPVLRTKPETPKVALEEAIK
jgi:hypothetical protein